MSTYQSQERFIPYPQPQPQPEANSLSPWWIRLPILMITGGVLLVLILVMALASFRMAYLDKITPGVYVNGADLGGMTRAEAITALSQWFTYADSAIFTFRYDNQLWQFTAGELGVSFDAESTVDQALTVNNNPEALRALIDQASAWFGGKSIAPILRYDPNIAYEKLAQIAQAINRPAQNAHLELQGSQLITAPAQMGRTMDVDTTLAQLSPYLQNLYGGAELALVVSETSPALADVSQIAQQLEAVFSAPITLTAQGVYGEPLGPWTISTDQIAALVTLELTDNGNGTFTYTPKIDMSAFAQSLEALAPGLITLPKNGRFLFDDATGQLVVMQPSVSGRTVNVEATLTALEQAVFSRDNRVVPMVFDLTLARYHDNITAQELGITQMVGEATTLFTGSGANRVHNIVQGTRLYNGILLAPDEELSFNDILGDVSVESGFVESKVISGERTTDGIGGGICQVSTTLFRAALNGGYWINERSGHAYRVGFYELNAPAGLDAAIWTPTQNFRFVNDSPYHLLIEAEVFVERAEVQFRFYSTNPGRIVEILPPTIQNETAPLSARYEVNTALQLGQVVQVDWAVGGADVTTVRLIKDLQGNVVRTDRVFTHYEAWGAIYQVAPGDARLNNP
ncbi:MAG: VanW family protein [Phototrophicales bacterium]|nr:VanW family protein [Phototrophicales bacterium]